MKRLLLFAICLLFASPVWASEEIGRQEDSASADGQVLMPIGCVRQDTIASSTSADGDYGNVKCNNVGRTYTSATIDAALPTGANTIGNVGITSSIPGTGATNLGKAEGNAHSNADTGVMSLCVRHDTSTTGLGADGTYAACGLSSLGEVYTSANTELPAAAVPTDADSNSSVPALNARISIWNGTAWARAQGGLTDTDDGVIARNQVPNLIITESHMDDGTQWIRMFGTATAGLGVGLATSHSAVVTADTQIKASAGYVHNLVCIGTDAAATAGSIKLYDNTAESGTVVVDWDVQAVLYSSPITFPVDSTFATGIYLGFTTTADVKCYVSYR